MYRSSIHPDYYRNHRSLSIHFGKIKEAGGGPTLNGSDGIGHHLLSNRQVDKPGFAWDASISGGLRAFYLRYEL